MSAASALQRAVGRCKTVRSPRDTAPHILFVTARCCDDLRDMFRSGNGATYAALRQNEGMELLLIHTESGGTALIRPVISSEIAGFFIIKTLLRSL